MHFNKIINVMRVIRFSLHTLII